MPQRAGFVAVAFVACSVSAQPTRDVWTAARPLPVERFEGYAAIAGGRLRFVGGITGVFGDIRTAHPSRRVDAYDPQRDEWREETPLPEDAPKHHLAVAVGGDTLYVVGGFDGILGQRPNEPFRPIARAYALENGAWTRLPDPPLARGGATAQVIGGKIYVAGGAPTEGQPSYADLDVYDIARGAWSKGPPMPTAREHVASCAIDGRFYVAGGWSGANRVARAEMEAFDTRTETWSKLPRMSVARGGLAAAVLDGKCHVIGGEDWALPFPGTFALHDVFDPKTEAWSTAAPMPTARHGFGLASNGRELFAVGGGPSMGNSYTSVVEVYLQ